MPVGHKPNRNPRNARVTISITEDIDRRANEIADRLGQSKSVTVGFLLGLGLNLVEMTTKPGAAAAAYTDEQQDQLAEHIAGGMAADFQELAKAQEK